MASTDERLGRLGLQHLVRKPEDLKAALLRKKRGIQVEGQEKKEKILRGRNDLRHYIEESDHKGDALYLQAAGIHPLVAAFIALPTQPTHRIVIESSIENHRNLLLESGTANHNGKQFLTNLPSGMLGRRILMYFFFMFYHDKDFSYDLSDADGLWEKLGYKSTDRHIKSYANNAFIEIIKTRLRFADFTENKVHYDYKGLTDISEADTRLVLVDQDDVIYNQSGLFNMAFPVDFEKTKKLKVRNGFWNVYLFLVDALPRIPPKEKARIEWHVLKVLFSDNHRTLENFKYFFIQTSKKVFAIYPKAEKSVDSTHSDMLILKYAPPPI